MNIKNHFDNLLKYNNWANNETFASLKTLEISNEKIEGIFAHIIISQILWLNRITQQNFKFNSFWENISPEDALALSSKSTQDWFDFIKDKDEEDFEQLYSYQNSRGENYSNKLKDIIIHVINHSTYHRGQVAVLVRKAGGIPAMTDYIHYKRSVQSNL